MSNKTRLLGSRLGRIDRVISEAEVQASARELGAAGPKRNLVVHVGEGETIAAAITRTMDVNPWVRGLSEAARARLTSIVVVRKHTRSTDAECQRDAWNEARALYEAGAGLREASDRSGFTELEVRERAESEGWAERVSV